MIHVKDSHSREALDKLLEKCPGLVEEELYAALTVMLGLAQFNEDSVTLGPVPIEGGFDYTVIVERKARG